MTTQKLRNWYAFSLMLLDALMLVLAFMGAYYLRVAIDWPAAIALDAQLINYVALMLFQMGAIIGVLFFYGQYYVPRAVSRVDQLYAVVGGVTLGNIIAIALVVLSFSGDYTFPRAMVIYSWLLAILMLMVGRVLHHNLRSYLLTKGWGKDRTLLVGSGEMARAVLQRIIWSPQLGYEVVGIVNGDNDEEQILGVPVLGTVNELPHLLKEFEVDEVIVAMPEKGHRATIEIIDMCVSENVSIKVFPDIFQFIATQPTIGDLGGLPLISVRDYALRGYWLVFKRLIDIVGAFLGLVFLSPLILLIGLAIKLESPGSVFFIQERMGLDGKPFPIIKFRSMRRDAEKNGPGWTVQNDPRQTKLGKFIRKVEIDELPQLINVLLGEMSLVGPRPEQPHYVQEFRRTVPHYMDRHRAKAGMTGWAQVNGLRGDTSVTERTKYDLWYIENWSLLLDVKIILRTLWQIFVGRTNFRWLQGGQAELNRQPAEVGQDEV